MPANTSVLQFATLNTLPGEVLFTEGSCPSQRLKLQAMVSVTAFKVSTKLNHHSFRSDSTVNTV